MKISELTENDCIHIRTKKEAKRIAKLLIEKNYNITTNGDIVTWRWIFEKEYPYLTITNLEVDVHREPFENIIPASKFLKQSISKKDLQEALSKVGEELSSMNERLGKLEAKSEPKTANGIEIHFDEVTKGLPEKWCVKIDDTTHEVLNVWAGEELKVLQPWGYFRNDKTWTDTVDCGYQLITFETFKKYVLKEEVKEAVELETGKWYTLREDSNVIACYRGEHSAYGLKGNGIWSTDIKMSQIESWEPATESEVFEALKAEAEKRGFKKGVIVKNHQGENELVDFDIRFMKEYHNGIYVFNGDRTGVWLMMNGIWATIIPQPEIDFSKAGQLVKNSTGDILLTTGEQSHSNFEAIVIKHHLSKNPKIKAAKSCFTLCTEPVTLKNE